MKIKIQQKLSKLCVLITHGVNIIFSPLEPLNLLNPMPFTQVMFESNTLREGVRNVVLPEHI